MKPVLSPTLKVRDISTPDAVRVTFDKLALDPYVRSPKAFRYRAFAQGKAVGSNIEWNTSRSFFQETWNNPYAGGMRREFAPIESDVLAFLATAVIPELMIATGEDDASIGVHQIRIVADDEQPGLPAPEGVHQDGFDYIAVIVVRRQNVSGGVSLVLDVTGERILTEQQLEPGASAAHR